MNPETQPALVILHDARMLVVRYLDAHKQKVWTIQHSLKVVSLHSQEHSTDSLSDKKHKVFRCWPADSTIFVADLSFVACR